MSSPRISKNLKKSKYNSISYAKWGYIFLLPFFLVYFVFQFYPLMQTFKNSMYENYWDGLTHIGPEYIGFENFNKLFDSNVVDLFGNTFILWILGFIPQIIISLVLAKWFTDLRLNLKATGFFKVVIYLPNVIMASSMAMLFFMLFNNGGAINRLIIDYFNGQEVRFLNSIGYSRGIIAFMNFLMWYGNTTIIFMAAIMGIDVSLYESAQIDGANSAQTFFKITLPLIRPMTVFVVVTSLIGGLQMFDIPQVFTLGNGTPKAVNRTVIMKLNDYIGDSKNFGMAGALSVFIFIVGLILSILVFLINNRGNMKKGAK